MKRALPQSAMWQGTICKGQAFRVPRSQGRPFYADIWPKMKAGGGQRPVSQLPKAAMREGGISSRASRRSAMFSKPYMP